MFLMDNNSRTGKSIKNVSYGLIVTVLNTLVSFASRTVLVKTLGTELLGLNGLFTEVIAMISLAELGVGMAIIYSLYKPLSENDTKKINQLMSLYCQAYKLIAIVTLVIGVLITPIVHLFITDIEFPLNYIRIVFILFVIKIATSYLFSYKTSLLNADQKQYIVSLVSALVKFISTTAIIIVLILFKNYIYYLLLLIAQELCTNIVLSKVVDKKYPFLDYQQKLSLKERKEILLNIKNIFIKRLSSVITSSTDNILISTLVSTIQVGIYSNYVVIFTVIRTLRQQFINGIAASIGNLNVTCDAMHCINVLRRLTYLFFVFGMMMASGLMATLKPFITIWIGDEYLLADVIVYVAVFNLFIEICCDPLWQYLEVSGLFKQDRNIALIGSGVNVVVSIILGIKIGMVGIFLGTVCTQVIQLILKTILLFTYKFKQPFDCYMFMLVRMGASYIWLLMIQYLFLRNITFDNWYLDFFLKGMISLFIALICSIPLFVGTDEQRYFFDIIRKIKTKVLGKQNAQSCNRDNNI